MDRSDENNETFRHETVSHEFRTVLQQVCMTKKKMGKVARSVGAVNAIWRAGETVETRPEAYQCQVGNLCGSSIEIDSLLDARFEVGHDMR